MNDPIFVGEQGETREIHNEDGFDGAEFLPEPRLDGLALGGIIFHREL